MGGIAFTPDGMRAYVATGDTVTVIDATTNAVIGTVPVASGFPIAITADGARAYVVNGSEDIVSVIDTATNTVVGAPIPVGRNPIAIAIAPPQPTPTGTPTATPTPIACVGDCDGDGFVTVDEVMTMVDIVLGSADISACRAGDVNGDGHITIDEILTAVNNALSGCPAPTPTCVPTPSCIPCSNAICEPDYECPHSCFCEGPTPAPTCTPGPECVPPAQEVCDCGGFFGQCAACRCVTPTPTPSPSATPTFTEAADVPGCCAFLDVAGCATSQNFGGFRDKCLPHDLGGFFPGFICNEQTQLCEPPTPTVTPRA